MRPRGENLEYDALRDAYQRLCIREHKLEDEVENLRERVDVMTRRIAELEDQNRLLHAALDGAYL